MVERSSDEPDVKPSNPFQFDIIKDQKPQEYYEAIKARFAQEREVRLTEGDRSWVAMEGELAGYEHDPYATEWVPREPLTDTVEVLFIGGGFSALLTSAKLRDS